MTAPSDTTGTPTPAAETPPRARPSHRPWNGPARAIAFLTILPVPAIPTTTTTDSEVGLTGVAVWFPVIGAAVGALAGGVRVGAEQLIGAIPATVLAMIALVVVTGALHQDGLADTADGLGARGGRSRRLEVMRDSSTGVFGALALIAWALLLVSTVASLDADRAFRALTTACALARWAALLHATTTHPARTDGLGAALHPGHLALAAASTVSIAAALAICGPGPGAAALGATLLVVAFSATFARRTLGGRTGDTLGATVAISEATICLVLLALWHH